MASLQRARGRFGLEVRRRGELTRMADLEQGGCCRLLFPRIAGAGLEAATVNISGGIAAGDRIEGWLICGEGSDLLLTSQAAERVYRARPHDVPATMALTCQLEPRSRLEWLPHGTIFFDGSSFNRHMRVNMAGSAEFLFLESRIFGRKGSGEVLSGLNITDRLSIKRDGKLVLEEALRLESQTVAKLLAQAAVSSGQGSVATVVLVSPNAMSLLEKLRVHLQVPEYAGFAASAWNGMLVVRGLAESGWLLEKALRGILALLRQNRPMPSTWRS
ncbi:urease accessory protein UreD [Acetobacter cibinongensis]|uniref:Urease accessory protein UreD n=2 Tax=Acetobacter cibinongensis TaxID=146475 RepID=A0A1Z5YWG4_9PROT|nr:urease accessory protein UreD [Acetobacter cibinongensis]